MALGPRLSDLYERFSPGPVPVACWRLPRWARCSAQLLASAARQSLHTSGGDPTTASSLLCICRMVLTDGVIRLASTLSILNTSYCNYYEGKLRFHLPLNQCKLEIKSLKMISIKILIFLIVILF